ncbi:Tn3 family transposase, partial [Klebsiella pneumoniae]|nr:Tn3 family transposase [Klebsiella pneumoniae]MCJ5036643.1 Tn3 family transposase [Klebsiella pneumoniae]MCJ5108100.1 Tn3 family transposase [Klebsiella pneumoniae]
EWVHVQLHQQKGMISLSPPTICNSARDRTTEGQHYRIAGLNLLTAVIIYWNTVHLGHAVTERRNEGLDVPPEFLPHISPLGWAHILLTGEYLWPKEPKA